MTYSKYGVDGYNLIDSNIISNIDNWIQDNVVGQRLTQSNIAVIMSKYQDYLKYLNLHDDIIKLYTKNLSISISKALHNIRIVLRKSKSNQLD